jgi:aryl-alcohol dehydrogenase-like predicted oxidoreductase
MQYINMGQTGLKVSRLCLGMMTYGTSAWRPWVLDEEQSRPFVREAIESGINFIDTADMYSRGVSEEVLGRAIKDFSRREDLVVATKVFFPMSDDKNDQGLSRKHIFHAVENSLRRLQTDYIDLYTIHRWDYETPIEETLEALNDIVRSGKVRYIGASSMFAWQFSKSLYVSRMRGWSQFVAMQNHYNLIYREEEREMIPLCRSEGIALNPWSPMARGFLSGNRRKEDWGATVRAQTDDYGQKMYYQDSDFEIADRVGEIARKRGVSPSQIALAWILNQPGITSPIIGASKPHHLREAVAALEIRLDDEERKALEEPYQPHGVLGHH